MKYWERKEKLFKYIDGVRQFFPLANEQLDIISRIIKKYNPTVKTFLDLGCGDGFLGHFIYKLYPNSQGIFVDISEKMINKAKLKDLENKSDFFVENFSNPNWFETINNKFDLIISGFSIHHIENDQKKRLYNDIYKLLNPNGIFLNLEHVSSPTKGLKELFNDLFYDGMMDYQKHIGEEKTRKEIRQIYNDPNHKKLNKLESVERQCEWLREIGFLEVDCYMKVFELALFGGLKKE